MKVTIHPKTGLPYFELDAKDKNDARAVKDMMETRGWKVMVKYMEVARESIIDAGKDGIRTRGKVELSSEKWAILKGWDECRVLGERITLRAAELKQKKEDAENATTPTIDDA